MKQTFVATLGGLLLMVTSMPVLAQTQIATLEELRRELAPGDSISIVETTGESVAGRVLRIDDTHLDVLSTVVRAGERRRGKELRIPLAAIQRLDRPRDPTRNGARVGAAVGAGFVGAMFVRAVAVDRNEMGEWAPIYLGYGAAFTGVGWLIGKAIDARTSKPHVRFERP